MRSRLFIKYVGPIFKSIKKFEARVYWTDIFFNRCNTKLFNVTSITRIKVTKINFIEAHCLSEGVNNIKMLYAKVHTILFSTEAVPQWNLFL